MRVLASAEKKDAALYLGTVGDSEIHRHSLLRVYGNYCDLCTCYVIAMWQRTVAAIMVVVVLQ
jgi:hypothetical protein